jgi:hypothetical protein
VVGPAAGAALKVDRGARVNTGWVLPGELQFDVLVEDLGASSAARISVLGAQELIQVAKIGHRAASFLSNRCSAAAILVSSLPWRRTGSSRSVAVESCRGSNGISRPLFAGRAEKIDPGLDDVLNRADHRADQLHDRILVGLLASLAPSVLR